MRKLLALILILVSPAALAATAIDGCRVRLDDGRIARLDGILAPAVVDPYGREAQHYLQSLLDAQPLTVPADAPVDPYNAPLIDQNLPDGRSLSRLMIEGGYARVYPSLPGAAALLPAEDEARRANRGLWTHPFYKVTTPETADKILDHYGIVEGKVLQTAQVKGKTYLNFGPDWKTDFTVELDRDTARQIDWKNLGGKDIRVRGWIDWTFGPHILVTETAQLELTDAAN